MEKMFVTREEAAAILRVTTQTIDDWRLAGKLPAAKVSRRVLIPIEAITRLRAAALTGKCK